MITVNFSGVISDTQRNMFSDAAQRWDEVIDTSFPPVTLGGQTLRGVVIDAEISDIDGPQGVLGQAGPTVLLPDTQLPATGIMQFDQADAARLERDGSFADVILHEMAHVLGFGTLWDRLGLVSGSGSADPRFTGSAAAREYTALGGTGIAVPTANTGGAGTREGHWRELTFGDELLTGFLSGSNRPISRMSIAAFEDMGYRVDISKADDFTLPSFRDLAEMGLTEAVRICDLCRVGRPEPVVMDAQGG